MQKDGQEVAKIAAKIQSPRKRSFRRVCLWAAIPTLAVAFLVGYQSLMWWKLRTVQRRSMEAHASAQWDQLAQLATIWLDWSPGDAQATLFAAIAAENRNSFCKHCSCMKPFQPTRHARIRTPGRVLHNSPSPPIHLAMSKATDGSDRKRSHKPARTQRTIAVPRYHFPADSGASRSAGCDPSPSGFAVSIRLFSGHRSSDLSRR